VVRTNISSGDFYDMLEAKGFMTQVTSVVEAFEHLLDTDVSGECVEVGPRGGYARRAPAEYLDRESETVMELVHERSRKLHEIKS